MGTKVHPAKPSKVKKEKKPKRERPPKPPPTGPPRFTGTATPTHAKWPSMFKRHLGVIETHVRTLDRVMQSMKAHMDTMPEDERSAWESGEVGKWGVICGMMNRTRMVLRDAREAGRGILPDNNLKEKKSLGAMGGVAEAYEAKRAASGANTKSEPAAEASNSAESDSTSDSDSDSSSNSSSSSDDSDSESTNSDSRPIAAPVFVPIQISKKRKLSDVEDAKAGEKTDEAADQAEPNPYFVVDTEPTPVVLNGAKPAKKSKKKHNADTETEKKGKKRAVEDESAPRKSKKEKHAPSEAEVKSAEVDFTAIEKQLQEEVEAGMKAAEKVKSEKKEKKRKRVSDGATSSELVVKKVKKDKSEKRKVDEDTGVEESSKKKKRKHKAE